MQAPMYPPGSVGSQSALDAHTSSLHLPAVSHILSCVTGANALSAEARFITSRGDGPHKQLVEQVNAATAMWPYELPGTFE